MQATAYRDFLDRVPDISDEDRQILLKYIDKRNAIRPTAPKTKRKQADMGVFISRALQNLDDQPSSLAACTAEDLLAVAGKTGSGMCTRDSRQTIIVTLKALAKFIDRSHHKIERLDELDDIRAGTPEKNLKDVLTIEEWERLINSRMTVRDRALLAMMYDGYHRPGEVLTLKWSDLHIDSSGELEYQITFKTEKTRTIVQKAGTTEILEIWRRECSATLDDATPIFPDPNGNHYQTITTITKLFKKLKDQTGIRNLMPSSIRNTAMKHDADAGLPVSYICLRAWGEPYNPMINLYIRPDSARIQRDLHEKNGTGPVTSSGSIGRRPVMASKAEEMRIRDLEERQIGLERLIAKMQKEKVIAQEK